MPRAIGILPMFLSQLVFAEAKRPWHKYRG